MIRERDDAVSTFVKALETPIHPNTFVRKMYWDEVERQTAALIGIPAMAKLLAILQADSVKLAFFRKSEQARVDLIIYLQRTGQL